MTSPSIGVGAAQGNNLSPWRNQVQALFAQLPDIQPLDTSTPQRSPVRRRSLSTPSPPQQQLSPVRFSPSPVRLSQASVQSTPSPAGVGSRPHVGMKQPRQRPLPPSLSSSSSSSRSRSRSRSRGGLTPNDLRRQFDLLAEDQRQRTGGRNISAVTHTNTITTVYKDGRAPSVHRTSSRLSTPTATP